VAKEIPIPEINKTYGYFDDGKIHESRRCQVVIKDVIPFDAVRTGDIGAFKLWKKEVKTCDWLYAQKTDYFVVGECGDEIFNDAEPERMLFVRALDGGWFSIGFNSGRLDIDGALLKTYSS